MSYHFVSIPIPTSLFLLPSGETISFSVPVGVLFGSPVVLVRP